MSQIPTNISSEDPHVGETIFDSTNSSWDSLRLSHHVQENVNSEIFTTTARDGQTILVVLEGNQEVEKIDGLRTRRAYLLQASVGLTPHKQVDRLRYRSKNTIRIARISIPQPIVEEAREQLRRVGSGINAKNLNALAFIDPTIFNAAISLIDGLRRGAPSLYADSAAQWLVSHLFTSGKFDGQHYEVPFVTDRLQDRRVARALEMMRAHLGDQIGLADIAEEAGISRFHVTRVFREKTGSTPYKLLMELRLQKACGMLRTTDFNIQTIAFQCGFKRAADFSTAFRHRYRCSPSEWRRQR